MLIVSNGAFKSGSTWLFNILRELTTFPAPPVAYLQPHWVNPSIDPKQLKAFLESHHHRSQNYLIKSHFNTLSQRRLLLSDPEVYIFNIKRDLRDVIVSAYYHDCKKHHYPGSFDQFFWSRGLVHASRVVRYHRLWDIQSPRIYVSSYQRLHQAFETEVQEMASFLNLSISMQDLNRIADQTTLHNLRQKYGETEDQTDILFFRKGTIGDWQNHFTESMLTELASIEQGQGLSPKVIFQQLKQLAFKR